MMTAAEVAGHFTGPSGDYLFARWRRPIVPVVFGVEEATLVTVKGAIEAVVALAGHRMAATDPEQGANLMIFFFRDWAELHDLPGLDGLVAGLGPRLERLEAEGANQYRQFRFEADGAIRACVAFLRMNAALAALPADMLALSLATQVILPWAEGAFARHPVLAQAGGVATLRPEVAALIRAAYDPVLPDAARDASHALRLLARLPVPAGPGHTIS